MFTATVSSPEEIWRRFAEQSSAFIVLANANSLDSLKSSVRDLGFVRKLGTMPIVVATYVSMDEDSLDPAAVAKALGLPERDPRPHLQPARARLGRGGRQEGHRADRRRLKRHGARRQPSHALSERRAGE